MHHGAAGGNQCQVSVGSPEVQRPHRARSERHKSRSVERKIEFPVLTLLEPRICRRIFQWRFGRIESEERKRCGGKVLVGRDERSERYSAKARVKPQPGHVSSDQVDFARRYIEE